MTNRHARWALVLALLAATAGPAGAGDVPANLPADLARGLETYGKIRDQAFDKVAAEVADDDTSFAEARHVFKATLSFIDGQMDDIRAAKAKAKAAPKPDAALLKAFGELEAIYTAESVKIHSLMPKADLLMKFQTETVEAVERLKTASGNINSRRLQYYKYLTTLNNLAASARASGTVGKITTVLTGDISGDSSAAVAAALGTVNALLTNHTRRMALAELVERGVALEERQLERFLSEVDPRNWSSRLGKLPAIRAPGPGYRNGDYAAADRKWRGSLAKQVSNYAKAYQQFRRDAAADMLELCKEDAKEKLGVFRDGYEKLQDWKDDLRQRLDAAYRYEQEVKRLEAEETK